MPRVKGSADLLEDRRKRALALLDSGESLNEAGRRIGCNPSSVMRCPTARRSQGIASAFLSRTTAEVGPDATTAPGQPSSARAMMHGYRTNLWTTARIAELIRSQFGIQYHRDHVGRLMHSLNWSPQKPERRALERDENVIERWPQKDWPRIKKTLRGWVPT
ncbi:MAG TPA: winged helix-turn-helix domain-containing protein [Candidatus Sulfotelmatobacter sp.]